MSIARRSVAAKHATVAPRGLGVRHRAAVLAGVASLLGAASVAAAPPPMARVRVTAALIDDVVRGALPLEIFLPASPPAGTAVGDAQTPVPATITELRYCGVSGEGAGRFRAVIRWGEGGPAVGGTPPWLAGEAGCRHGLGELAKRAEVLALDLGKYALADVEAAWRPWELRLTLVHSALVGPSRAAEALPEGRHEMLTISTAGLRVATDAGPLTFHVVPSFAATAVEAHVLLGDAGSDAPPAGRPPLAPPGLAGPAAPANVAAELPYGFVNRLLQILTGAQPLSIPLEGDVVDLQSLALVGGTSGVTVSGLATPRALRESARVTAQASGGDLRVVAVRADAQLESCAGQGMLANMACNARNAARTAAATALASGASARYQGQLVRELAGAQSMRFELGGRRFRLDGELLRLAAGAAGLSLSARMAVPAEAVH